MRYRRAFIPDGSFFFTAVTERRRPLLASVDAVGVLRAAFRAVRATRPFEVDAIVVPPDHLHCIRTLPPGDADFAMRWRLIKTWCTKHADPPFRTEPNCARAARREQAFWQHQRLPFQVIEQVDESRAERPKDTSPQGLLFDERGLSSASLSSSRKTAAHGLPNEQYRHYRGR